MSTTSRRKRRTRVKALLAWLLGAFMCFSSCKSAQDPTGGETHFLKMCSPTTEPCADGLSCVCGVCTETCTNGEECQGLPTAECVTPADPSACPDGEASGRCDVTCNVDADCRRVSDAHRCVLGFCRTGPGGCPMGEVEPNQVLIIGDSFFAISHQITAYLEELAREAGALEVGERYRDNSTTSANALAMGGNGIASQYQGGLAEAPVEVVVMNGGGADALVASCAAPVVDCPALVAAATAAEELLAQMAADGVSEVIYAFYPDAVDAGMRERLDALRVLIEPVCASSPVPCHWVDLRPTLSGAPGEYLSADGLIPTAAGSEASAGAIWATMQRECIAQ
jgi:hypothetical protein